MASKNMIFISQLIRVMNEKYFFLKMLNPKNELLKYFIVDEDGLFTVTPIGEIEDEFVDRFRGNAPKIRDVIKGNVNISFKEYSDRLFFSCFKNYISNLEEAINLAEKMN